MDFWSRARRAGAAVAVVAVASSGVAVASSPATAETDGAHFVVVGAKGETDRLEKAVAEAGGATLVTYPQIGVVVAESTDAEFAESVRTAGGVQQAGATRALAELLPESRTSATMQRNDLEATSTVVDDSSAAVDGQGAAADDQEPLAPNQWDMRQINADKANEVSQGDPDVVVGVLDTGIDPSHPDLAPNIDAANSVGCADEGIADPSQDAWEAINWDHGTHVAGTIAAARNGEGIAGVAPDVSIASVKVTDEDGYIYPEYALCGFMWAAEQGMDVTNNSYFVDPWYLWCRDDPDQKAVHTALSRAIDYAADADVVNVAALGNSNWDLAHDIVDENSPNNQDPIVRETGGQCDSLPAQVPGFIGVSSVGPEGDKSYFSNYGVQEADVTAPGGDSTVEADTPDGEGTVLSTVFDGKYGYKQGTSMASPHAAGVAALLRSTHPELSARNVATAMTRQARQQPCPDNPYDPTGDGEWEAYCQGGPTGKGFYGAGLIDALAAVTS